MRINALQCRMTLRFSGLQNPTDMEINRKNSNEKDNGFPFSRE